jgi:hypothetical protein
MYHGTKIQSTMEPKRSEQLGTEEHKVKTKAKNRVALS